MLYPNKKIEVVFNTYKYVIIPLAYSKTMSNQFNSGFTGVEWLQMRCSVNRIDLNSAFLNIENGMPYGDAVGSPLSVPNNKQSEEIEFAIKTYTVQKLISLERTKNMEKNTGGLIRTNDIVMFLMLGGLAFYLLIFAYLVSQT